MTAASREQMAVVLAGHVDHGKSTVVGRLLADAGGLADGKLEQVREYCLRNAKPFEYAFLLDALKDEQAQGITIDAARVFFGTALRDYLLIDAPGHVEFLRNMVTGAARASAALLVIDAREGVRENSRRHGYLLRLLGVSRVVVLVNKMDLVGYEEGAFLAVRREYEAFLRELGAPAASFIPVCGTQGDNLTAPSANMAWYGGPLVLQALDDLPSEADDAARPLRLPVQDVYRFSEAGDDRRIVAGTIASGALRAGDELVFYPSGKSSRVASIESASSGAGEPVGLTLTDQIYVRRGELAARKAERAPVVGRRFRVTVLWLGRRPFEPDRDYWFKLGASRVKARLTEVSRAIDCSTLAAAEGRTRLERHEAGDCVLELEQPVACDLAAEDVRMGRFVLVDEHRISGGGLILEALADDDAGRRERVMRRNLHWQNSLVSLEDRERRFGQRARLVLVTGDEAAARKAVAKALERRLFEAGRAVYYLGIGSVLYGLDADIRGRQDRAEDIRRLAEVAHILLDAGLVVVGTAAALVQDDIELVRAALDEGRLLSVWIGRRAPTEARCDLFLAGAEPDQAAREIERRLLDDGGGTPL